MPRTDLTLFSFHTVHIFLSPCGNACMNMTHQYIKYATEGFFEVSNAFSPGGYATREIIWTFAERQSCRKVNVP